MSESRQQRRLAAILAADVIGYTRAMAADEAGTLKQLQTLLREVIAPAVAGQDGRVFKEMGDGILVEFPSAVGAAQAAAAIQTALSISESALQLRIGLHVGDVIVEGDDLFGDGVNIAARLEAEAEPGGVVVSDAFRRHAEGRAGLIFDDLGTRQLKNVADPMHVHLLRREGDDGGMRPRPTARAPLRRLAMTGAVAVMLALVALWAVPRFLDREPSSTAQASGTPAIAVLPFDNLSQDVEQAYFADGLAEDLIADLSKIQGIQVVSRTSSFAEWVKSAPVEEIAERLRVRYVVEGSVRRASDRLRITTSLVDTMSNTPIWTERFDGSNSDVFGFQDRISGEIIAALRVQLTPAEQQAVETRGTDNIDAYDAYLRGLRLLSERRFLDTEANAAAQAAFEEAIRLDPDYALAYAGLGWTKWLYVTTIYAGDSPEKAFDLAEKSLSLADNALGHRTLAKKHFAPFSFSFSPTRKIDLAVAELEAAQRLQPNNPDVLADLALALSFVGRPRDALTLIRKAMELNSSHPDWYFAASGIAYLLVGDAELAIRDLERWLEATPSWHVPHMFLASAYGQAGQVESAKSALDRHRVLNRGTKLTFYFVKRHWPMAPVEEEIFIRGLQIAGMKDTPG
jgi:adenylate cyclase